MTDFVFPHVLGVQRWWRSRSRNGVGAGAAIATTVGDDGVGGEAITALERRSLTKNTPVTIAMHRDLAARHFTVAALGAETVKEKFDALVDQEPFAVSLATAFVPLGIFLALMGRKHHDKFMVFAAFAIGAGGTVVLADSLREVLKFIPDGDLMDVYIPLGVGLVLALFVRSSQNLFYGTCGLGLGLGGGLVLNEVFEKMLSRDGVPGYADTIVTVASAILGWLFLTKTVSNFVGLIYAALGAAMIAASLSLLTYPLGGEPELWPGDLNLDGGRVPLKDGSINWKDKYTLISVGVALVFLLFGIRGGEAPKSRGAVTESSPLLGDPEQGKRQ